MGDGAWRPNKGPQERFLSLTCREALYGGAAGGGKALDLRTLVPTPGGWKTIASLAVGDAVFDEDGKPTYVVAKSDVMCGHRCYALNFDDGAQVIADACHLWKVWDGLVLSLKTTEQLFAAAGEFSVGSNPFLPSADKRARKITSIVTAMTVPVQCIKVEHPRGMFLITNKFIPTHNSESLLVDAARYVGKGHGPAYQAILLRRTFTELEKSLIQRSHQLYPQLGGKYKSDSKIWTFAGGERIHFGHCEHDTDVMQYKSAEFQFIGFDELTDFNEYPYTYMFSRLRSSKKVPLRMRAGTNPGGRGHDWVMHRWRFWLDPDCEPRAAPGEVLYVVTTDEGEELVKKGCHPMAMGRCFVPSTIDDNQYLRGTDYEVNLSVLDAVERERLRKGNWLIKPSAGLYFKRQWCEMVDAAPLNARWCRYWDRAATEKGGDYTAGVKMARTPDGRLYVGDVARFQHSPGGVMARIKYLAAEDGRDCVVGLSEDPGAAGKFETAEYAKQLIGFNVRFIRETGNKLTRFQPFSAQAERHMICVVRGHWNEKYFQELEGFPDVAHDDQIDASSGAMQLLSRPTVRRLIPSNLCA